MGNIVKRQRRFFTSRETLLALALAISFAPAAGWAQLKAIGDGEAKGPPPRLGVLPEDADLDPFIIETMRSRALPAYFRGNPYQLVETLAAMLPKVDDEELVRCNGVLASQGLPTVDQMLIESRLNLVTQRSTAVAKPPGRHELLVVIPAIKARIDEVLSDAIGHVVLQEKLPNTGSLSEYENLFWRIHVLEQKLTTARRLSSFGKQLQLRARRYVRRAGPRDQAVYKTDFSINATQLDDLAQELDERKIELRTQRLAFAHRQLHATTDLREKMEAAYAAGLDGSLLTEFFKGVNDRLAGGETVEFRRPALGNELLEDEVQRLIEESKKTAGDVAEKGHLLFTGMHWWLRGRYGRGSEGGGLLKPKSATRSLHDMFRLYMPEELYDLDRKADGSSVQAPIDRRHHYIWAFEPRRVVSKQYNHISKATFNRDTTKTTLSYFY